MADALHKHAVQAHPFVNGAIMARSEMTNQLVTLVGKVEKVNGASSFLLRTSDGKHYFKIAPIFAGNNPPPLQTKKSQSLSQLEVTRPKSPLASQLKCAAKFAMRRPSP